MNIEKYQFIKISKPPKIMLFKKWTSIAYQDMYRDTYQLIYPNGNCM